MNQNHSFREQWTLFKDFYISFNTAALLVTRYRQYFRDIPCRHHGREGVRNL